MKIKFQKTLGGYSKHKEYNLSNAAAAYFVDRVKIADYVVDKPVKQAAKKDMKAEKKEKKPAKAKKNTYKTKVLVAETETE